MTKLKHGVLLTEPGQFALTFFHSFSWEASLRCAGLQWRGGGGGRDLYSSSCNCKKLGVVLGKLLPTALAVIETGRGTGT